MYILSPETDNCPPWICGRERMTVENISWSISTKECCRPRRGLNPRPPGLQSDGASNWAIETEIEAVLNDWPLTHVSSNLHDLEPLTPSHLLYGRKRTSLPYPELHRRRCYGSSEWPDDTHTSVQNSGEHNQSVLETLEIRVPHGTTRVP